MKIRILKDDFSKLVQCCQAAKAKQQTWILRAVEDLPEATDPEPPEPMTPENSTTIHVPEKIRFLNPETIRRAIRAKIRIQLPDAQQKDALEEAIQTLSKVTGMSIHDARTYAENAFKKAVERLTHEKTKTREKAVAVRR